MASPIPHRPGTFGIDVTTPVDDDFVSRSSTESDANGGRTISRAGVSGERQKMKTLGQHVMQAYAAYADMKNRVTLSTTRSVNKAAANNNNNNHTRNNPDEDSGFPSVSHSGIREPSAPPQPRGSGHIPPPRSPPPPLEENELPYPPPPPSMSHSHVMTDSLNQSAGIIIEQQQQHRSRRASIQDAMKKARLRQLPAWKWTAPDVEKWLLGLGLGAYVDSFRQNGVDGPTLLELTREQVKSGLFVCDVYHLQSFEWGLEDLKNKTVTNVETWPWSINKVMAWLERRGLAVLQPAFRIAAVHGGVLFRLVGEEEWNGVIHSTIIHHGDEGGGDTSGKPLILSALLASIERAKIIGPNPISDDAPPDWGPRRVKDWLTGLHLAHLEGIFKSNCVNGSLLLRLDAATMRQEMGVTEIQSIVLERAVKALRKDNAKRNSLTLKVWRTIQWMATKKRSHGTTQQNGVKRRGSQSSIATNTTTRRPSMASVPPPSNREKKLLKQSSSNSDVSTPTRPPRPQTSLEAQQQKLPRVGAQNSIRSAIPVSMPIRPPATSPPPLPSQRGSMQERWYQHGVPANSSALNQSRFGGGNNMSMFDGEYETAADVSLQST